VIQTKTAKGSKTKQFEPKQDTNFTDNNDTSGSDSHTLAEICCRHHCDRCGKACYIDPGPPPIHKPFMMEQLSVWTSLVVHQNLKLEPLLRAHHIYTRNSKRQQLIKSQIHCASPSVETASPFHPPQLPQQVVPSLKLHTGSQIRVIPLQIPP
jgi:hypothetical protein